MRLLIQTTLCLFLSGTIARAQSHHSDTTIRRNETVIIKKDTRQGNGQTTIEVREGNVFVDGESVATFPDDGRQVNKKIIINGDDQPAMNIWRNNDNPAPRRVMLGVQTANNDAGKGAEVSSVVPGSPAERAGIKAGDRITSIDGRNINDAGDLVDEISRHSSGDEVTINYQRGSKSLNTKANLSGNDDEVNDPFSQFFGPDGNGNPQNMPDFDFGNLNDLFNNNGPRLGITAEDADGRSGVKVVTVKPGSPAEAAGLKEGDIVTGMDGNNVASVDELQMKVMAMETGDRKSLSYTRNGKSQTTFITIPRLAKRKEL